MSMITMAFRVAELVCCPVCLFYISNLGLNVFCNLLPRTYYCLSLCLLDLDLDVAALLVAAWGTCGAAGVAGLLACCYAGAAVAVLLRAA
jgi:hypothetical protein